MKRTFFSFVLLLSSAVQAGTLTLTAKTVTGNGSVTPELTWLTSPAAQSCTASGSWTGAKAPAGGTEVLPTTNTSKTYTMACAWNDGFATVTWANPTQRTDGTAYTNGSLTRIFYGTSQSAMTTTFDAPLPATAKTFSPLAPATWYFKVKAVDLTGVESDFSNTGSKVILSGNDTESVTITVNPIPLPPTNVTVQ